jgi:nondiscriminating aspartyl-tRNA synthetase
MQRTYSNELTAHVGERIRLAGWLHHQRRLSQRTFLLLRDVSGIAQVVVEDGPTIEGLSLLSRESVLEIEGHVVRNEQAPGGVEVQRPTVEVISASIEPPAIDLHRPELKARLATILDHAAIALRHPRQRAIFQIAAASVAGFRATLDARGFVEIQTPKIVGASSEGGAALFNVDYFGRPAYLAQSPQIYKQMMVGVFERVYETAPAFRAEPHDTPRHLAEFVSLDAEVGFIQDHHTVMRFARDAIAGMLSSIAERAAEAVKLLDARLPSVPDAVPVLHFADVQRMIEADTGEVVVGEPDLAPSHERWIGNWASLKYGSDFVFVEGYPMSKRPFYTHPDPDRKTFSNSFDLLFRGVEVMTGGQRLHRYDEYIAALADREIESGPLTAYLEAFRTGMPPHGGFAIGLERWTAQLVGLPNAREATLFPRDLHRLVP